MSEEAARDKSASGKYVVGTGLAYALELERRRAGHRDEKATAEDRLAARQTDLQTGAGSLFDEEALEDIP